MNFLNNKTELINHDENPDNKISLLFSTFSAGGGERVMMILANEFVERGYKVDVIVFKAVGEYSDDLHKDIKVYDLNVRRMIFSLPKLILYLRKANTDVLIATDEHAHLLALSARFIARSQTQIVLRVGNMFSELYSQHKGLKHALTFLLIKRFYRYANAIVAISKGVAYDISTLTKIKPNKVFTIYNPKPIKTITKLAEDKSGLQWLDEKTLPVVLSVGRLREQKDLRTLIKAFSVVIKKIPARLVLVGSGMEQKRLEKFVEELGIKEFVDFSGYIKNPYAFMFRADVFVTTSLWEGLSNSLIEAMVCGVPIIATDCNSGPRETLAPNTDPLYRMSKGVEYAKYGVLVPIGSVDCVVKALEKMLEDKDMRDKYKIASLERAQDFDSDEIIDEYESVIGF